MDYAARNIASQAAGQQAGLRVVSFSTLLLLLARPSVWCVPLGVEAPCAAVLVLLCPCVVLCVRLFVQGGTGFFVIRQQLMGVTSCLKLDLVLRVVVWFVSLRPIQATSRLGLVVCWFVRGRQSASAAVSRPRPGLGFVRGEQI